MGPLPGLMRMVALPGSLMTDPPAVRAVHAVPQSKASMSAVEQEAQEVPWPELHHK